MGMKTPYLFIDDAFLTGIVRMKIKPEINVYSGLGTLLHRPGQKNLAEKNITNFILEED